MFKKIALMIFTLSMLAVGSCFAAMVGNVPDSEASLGGITLGNKMTYVRSIYGELTEQRRAKTVLNENAILYRYGKGFFILENLYNYTVEEILTNANNGISTPMGVTVGVPKSTVDTLYGEGRLWNGAYLYLTDQGKRIEIKYEADAKGVMVVQSIYVRYPA
ncbi:hypothetical protein [Megasphaera massiliensis]|uniref:hypothetical protein n=1 Tax=Megasphaera massiliensis TaxID=1232428 RepID=UPI000408698E|nr:hypothetical protein [Megasphaera massiliensis]MBS6256651.1 hypothetical protein [Megasphaera sp.]